MIERLVVLIAVLLIVSMAILTLTTISRSLEIAERAVAEERKPNPKCTLPCICRRHYNSGTDEWIDCMMVGYKEPSNGTNR